MSSYPNESVPNEAEPPFGTPPVYTPIYPLPPAPSTTSSDPYLQTPRGVYRLASPLARLGAHIIDLMVMGAISLVGVVMAFAASGFHTKDVDFVRGAHHYFGYTNGWHNLLFNPGIFAIFALLAFIAPFAYRVILTARGGQTLGKKIMGIRVITATGTTPTMGVATIREVLGYAINGMVWSLGWLWLLWDQRRQTWGDKIASTFVVNA